MKDQPKKAVIRNGRIVYGDDAKVSLPNETQARANREDQRTRFRKEMLQPNEAAYYKAYPDQAANLSDGLRRRFS